MTEKTSLPQPYDVEFMGAAIGRALSEYPALSRAELLSYARRHFDGLGVAFSEQVFNDTLFVLKKHGEVRADAEGMFYSAAR